MKLFNKLKNILFDEVTTEIPVITKEEKNVIEKEDIKKPKEEPKRRAQQETEEDVIITRIETPKREKKPEVLDEEVYMPKLKEEAKEEVKKSTFTFPVFGDDEEEIVPSKKRSNKEDKYREKEMEREKPKERRSETQKTKERPRDTVGYTNAFDYSYGKYKGDYKASREKSRDILTKTLETKEEHKVFTPSPIISPVYGVLNENYRKDDIVDKVDEKKRVEPLDLDTVRRKAYGTLEDEIEASLGNNFVEETHEEPAPLEYEENEEEGISISDLLVDADDTQEKTAVEVDDTLENESTLDEVDMGLFDKVMSSEDEEEEEEPEEVVEEDELGILEPTEEIKDEIDVDEEITDEKETSKSKDKEKEKETNNEGEMLGEEDLFDLIESIYERKDEE